MVDWVVSLDEVLVAGDSWPRALSRRPQCLYNVAEEG